MCRFAVLWAPKVTSMSPPSAPAGPYLTDRAKSVTLLIVQAFVSCIVVGITFPLVFKGAGCGTPCANVISTAFVAQLWAVAGAFVISLVAVIALSAKGRQTWRVPAMGTMLVSGVGIITAIAILAA